MAQTNLSQLILDQSKDLFWVVDHEFNLIYGNERYQNAIKAVTGHEHKLLSSAFISSFGKDYTEKWKSYYTRALCGESFEVEDFNLNPTSNKIEYGLNSLEPLRDENNNVIAVSCQSKNITHIANQKSKDDQMKDASLDVFCTVNEQGDFVHVSAASQNLWGYSPQELIGKAYIDLIIEEDLAKTNQIATAIINGEEVKSFINRYKKKDGSIAYNLWSGRWDEEVKLMFCVARDAKEKVEQEEKIQQSEQRFKALVQEGSDLIGIIDAEGNYKYVSPTSSSVLGISPEKFIGKSAFEFIHPDDVERTLKSLHKVTTENKVIVEPFRFQNKKKEWRWIETVLTNMLSNPAVNGIVSNSRDVTEKVNAQKQIEASEQFNRTVLESSPDCLKILDTEGRLQFMNYNGLCQMEIDDFSSFKNKNWWTLWGTENESLVKASLSKALKGETVQFTALCHTAKGTPKWWDVMVSPVGKTGEPVQQLISVSRDITEQKNKEFENELMAQISINFNSENNYLVALKELCKTISRFGKFEWVELWMANLQKTHVNLLAHYLSDFKDEKFYDVDSDVNEITYSESLAGKVWADNKELLWDDVENNENFIRKGAAKKIGLKSILGIPLTHDGEVVGVLKIGSKIGAGYFLPYTKLFKQLEGFIGSELKRKKLENELGHLFDSIPDILCLTDFKGRFLKINKAGCKLLGYEEEEILLHSFSEFVHPDDSDISYKQLERNADGTTTQEFENRYVTKSGDVVWLSWFSNASVAEGIIYSTAKNITEEKKLRELNRKTSSLAKIGSWEMDMVNQRLFWSEEVYKMHETDPNLFKPDLHTGILFYREDFRTMVELIVAKTVTTGERFDFEAVLVTAKKKELWVRVIGETEMVDGVCKRIYGSFQDINSLKESENRLLSLSENLPGVVYQYIINSDGKEAMQFISGAVEQMWGYTTTEIMADINLLWNQIQLGGDIEEVKSSLSKAINNKSRWSCRFRTVMQNGDLKTHFGNSGAPVFMADGSIMLNVIILDITKEAKNEFLLEQVTKLAKIGSWEVNFIENKHYWSQMVHTIAETNSQEYVPDREATIALYREDYRPMVAASIFECKTNGKPINLEAIVVTANKNEKWVRVIANAQMKDGECIKILGSIQDITELKLAEAELLNSEQKYRKLAQQLQLHQVHLTNAQQVAKIGSWETNLKDLSVIWSEETYRIFGVGDDGSNITYDKFLSSVHPKDREKVGVALSDSFQDSDQKFKFIEHRILTADGVEKIVEERWKIEFDEDGIPLLAIGSCQDVTARKKGEEERNSLLTTLENSLNEIYIFDEETFKFSYVNKGALRNLGYTEKEIEALTPLDLKPDFTLASFKNLVSSLISKEKNEIIFFTSHKRKDGTLYPVEVHLQLVSVGITKRFVAIILDITDRIKAEEEIKFKANLLNTIEQAAIATDLDGKVNYWNKAAENIYGWSKEEAIGVNIIQLTTPETSMDQGMRIMEMLKEGQTWSGNFKVSKKDGTHFTASVSNSPVYDENNILSGIIGVSTNVSQKLKNEGLLKLYTKQLESSNERFEKVTEATNDAIWDVDIVNKTYYRSKSFERFFGEGASGLFDVSELWSGNNYHEEDLERIKNEFNSAIANPLTNRWESEFRLINDSGELFHVIDRSIILRDKEGEAIRLVGAMTNISDQKQMTVELGELNKSLQLRTFELERSNEELEQFAFVASHDLQEPLRMITSFMDQLKRKYEERLDEKALQYIYFATDGAKRMKQIIIDLLLYSRSNKQLEEKEPIDINELTADFIQLRRKLISEKKASINFQNLPIIYSYKAAVTQIVHCLLDNALKYTKVNTKPVVNFSAKELEMEWEFSIQDNGIGILAQFFDKIFIIFQRLHNKEDYGGTGIGLSIAKRHVEFLGGQIWLESEPGTGTTFYFTLPKTI